MCCVCVLCVPVKFNCDHACACLCVRECLRVSETLLVATHVHVCVYVSVYVRAVSECLRAFTKEFYGHKMGCRCVYVCACVRLCVCVCA